jgi:hypothetical protein
VLETAKHIFLRFEKICGGRLIGWYRPTDRAELLPIFLFEKRKNFFGKNASDEKNFLRFEKFFWG